MAQQMTYCAKSGMEPRGSFPPFFSYPGVTGRAQAKIEAQSISPEMYSFPKEQQQPHHRPRLHTATEYTEVFHFSENGNNITTYANADGEILHFSYSIAAGTGVSYIEEEGYSVTSILIGNNPADLYISTDTTKSNGIIWCNERTIFYISAFLDESTLISLAESVVSKK